MLPSRRGRFAGEHGGAPLASSPRHIGRRATNQDRVREHRVLPEPSALSLLFAPRSESAMGSYYKLSWQSNDSRSLIFHIQYASMHYERLKSICLNDKDSHRG